MADAKLSKLYLSPGQYQEALDQVKNKPTDLRLGQWLINKYGQAGVAYPHLFYLDDPTKAWDNVEVISDTQEGT